jgi:hypothetical protein
MVLLNLLTEEEKEKYLRPYGEKQTITYQGLFYTAVAKNSMANMDIEVAVAPTVDKSGMYYCVCKATAVGKTLVVSDLGSAKKADPVAAIEAASLLAKVNTLRTYLNTTLECFEVVVENNPPNPITPVATKTKAKETAKPEINQPKSEPDPAPGKEEKEEDKQVWNKKDTTELLALRKLMGLSHKDLSPYIKDWSRGLSSDPKDITQENIKAFNRYMRRRALESFSEEKINQAVESAWKEAGCLE